MPPQAAYGRSPLMGRQALALTHGDGIRTSGNHDAVGIMDDAVADSVGQGGFANLLVPAAYVELGAENDGSLFVPGLGNFQQVSGFGFSERAGDEG